MYSLVAEKRVEEIFSKLAKRDKAKMEAIAKKIDQIREDPSRFKPLHPPMKNLRRVHFDPFVLVYSVDERKKQVTLWDYDHHDKVYRKKYSTA